MNPDKNIPLSEDICPRCGRIMKQITMSAGRFGGREKSFICDPCTLQDTLIDVLSPYEPEAKNDLFNT